MTQIISLTNMPATILLLPRQMKIHYIVRIYSINCILEHILIVTIVSASSARVGSYGHSWRCDAIKSRVASDVVGRSLRKELKDYLVAPLEDVDDVIAWWGVSVKFVVELFFIPIYIYYLHSTIPFNIPSCQRLPGITLPFRALLLLPNVLFLAAASRPLLAAIVCCQRHLGHFNS
jgi:hypothetical protein